MDSFCESLRGFKETLRLYRKTLGSSGTHHVKLKFLNTIEQLIGEAATLVEKEALFSEYGHLRGFCETVVMFECLLEHETEGSLEHYETYRKKVESYMASLRRATIHAENDRPHQYDWYNAMKRGGFTTSKVSLKTLANEANAPLLNTFHILNVKIHNAEYFTTMLEDETFRSSELTQLNTAYLMVLNHVLRILTLYLRTEASKPLLDSMVEKRNHMKRILGTKEKDL